MRSVILAALALSAVVTQGATPPSSATPAPAEAAAPPDAIVTPVAGPRYDDDAALPAHAEDVVDYTLRATLDPVAHAIHGEGTITWRNTSTTAVREMWLHLYLNAFKNEHSSFLCERVGGRGSAAPEDWGWIDVHRFVVRARDTVPVDEWPHAQVGHPVGDVKRCDDLDESEARVPLPREIAPGETTSCPSSSSAPDTAGRFTWSGNGFPRSPGSRPTAGGPTSPSTTCPSSTPTTAPTT